MSILPPDDARGFGKAVRLAATHGFESQITRFQAGDLAEAMERSRVRRISLVLHGIALLIFVMLSSWCGHAIGTAIITPLSGLTAAFELFAAILITFLGMFAFMRLAQAALRALFDFEDDVFVIRRKHGSEIVIPKDPDDEDELRNRLMRGITLSKPVRPAGG